jgi:hypothetical protein
VVRNSTVSGVTLDALLTWTAHLNRFIRKEVQRLGVLGPLLNRRSGLSIRNAVLIYKQLIRPMMVYARLIWRFAARSHVRKLQLLEPKSHRIAINAFWYVGNKQIHEDFEISYFADHVRILSQSKSRWCAEHFMCFKTRPKEAREFPSKLRLDSAFLMRLNVVPAEC